MDTFTCPRRSPDLTNNSSSMYSTCESDHWLDHGICSYCGSQKPEAVFTAIDCREELIPTDKDYKLYLPGYKKIYFQHFSEDDRKKFVSLLNERKIKLAYPGYFYTLPYFVKAEKK